MVPACERKRILLGTGLALTPSDVAGHRLVGGCVESYVTDDGQ
jgi:hypothetical protein